MKIALFAPELTPNAGGIWQYYQWVARAVASDVSLLLLAPAQLLQELHNRGVKGSTEVGFEAFKSSIVVTAAYRILEEKAYGRVGRFKIPFYRKLTNGIKNTYYNGDVIAHALRLFLQRERIKLIHNPVQWVQQREVVRHFPYVMNPHDYQHEHFPDFFSADELELRRNVWYRDQRNAAALVVHSQQTRQDAIQYLGIPEERVFYAPYGPLDTYPEPDQATLRKVTDELNLPERFVFYPAYTWPHKNHLALVEAIYSLKKRDIEVNVVFTVVDGAYGEILKQEIVSRDLGRQVTIVGRVSPEKMGVLYRQSAFVVVPSLFEQNSGPVLEAIHFGKAVAVSNIKEVELTLAGAGLLFDPHSVQQIADAIDQLWSSSAALAEAEASIQRRNAEMSWEPFRRVYRQAYAYALGR